MAFGSPLIEKKSLQSFSLALEWGCNTVSSCSPGTQPPCQETAKQDPAERSLGVTRHSRSGRQRDGVITDPWTGEWRCLQMVPASSHQLTASWGLRHCGVGTSWPLCARLVSVTRVMEHHTAFGLHHYAWKWFHTQPHLSGKEAKQEMQFLKKYWATHTQ